MQKVTAKIQLNAIQNNAKAFKMLTKNRLFAVVKANAYGHGAEEVVSCLSSVADGFAVALIDEAIAIRAAACGKDILVFTPPINEEEGYALAVNNFMATVPDLRTAKLLVRVCEKYRLSLRSLQYFPNKCLNIPLDKQMFAVYTNNTNICSFCRDKRESSKGKK